MVVTNKVAMAAHVKAAPVRSDRELAELLFINEVAELSHHLLIE